MDPRAQVWDSMPWGHVHTLHMGAGQGFDMVDGEAFGILARELYSYYDVKLSKSF